MNQWLTRAVCTSLLILGTVGGAEGIPEGIPQANPPAAPALIISPAKIDFGSYPVSGPGVVQTATVSNGSSAPVAINLILTSGFDFRQTNNCGPNLAAGASCSVQVTFKPATTGPRIGTLNLFDFGAGSPHMIAMGGVGE